MNDVVVDAATRTKFASVSARVAVRDEAGEVLGDFIPKAVQEPLVPWDPSLTKEELDRRARTARGRPLADVLKGLGIE